MRKKRSDLAIHCVLIALLALTLLPFVFVVNNSFRRTHEQYHSFFGLPDAVTNAQRCACHSRLRASSPRPTTFLTPTRARSTRR